ncbi:MAG TPA: putative toxin-antitoxin system toxin component, PIN family [Candidatus Methylomirabilis sp.]|nr:putative toxin-antitoxin system toxin component, PIN family [Candidatus Methylomirabilis sp.]
MRVVLDTNILLSALLWRGAPHRCLLAVQAGLAVLVLSRPILEELRVVLVTKFQIMM